MSLSLSENDEDPGVKGRPGYSSLEFLITTGESVGHKCGWKRLGVGGGKWSRAQIKPWQPVTARGFGCQADVLRWEPKRLGKLALLLFAVYW